jgi:hypothetical protein
VAYVYRHLHTHHCAKEREKRFTHYTAYTHTPHTHYTYTDQSYLQLMSSKGAWSRFFTFLHHDTTRFSFYKSRCAAALSGMKMSVCVFLSMRISIMVPSSFLFSYGPPTKLPFCFLSSLNEIRFDVTVVTRICVPDLENTEEEARLLSYVWLTSSACMMPMSNLNLCWYTMHYIPQ